MYIQERIKKAVCQGQTHAHHILTVRSRYIHQKSNNKKGREED